MSLFFLDLNSNFTKVFYALDLTLDKYGPKVKLSFFLFIFYFITIILVFLLYLMRKEDRIFLQSLKVHYDQEMSPLNRLIFVLVTFFISFPHYLWIKGVNDLHHKIVIVPLAYLIFFGGIVLKGNLFYIYCIYVSILFLSFVFALSIKYVPYFTTLFDSRMFRNSSTFKETYISFLYGNMMGRMIKIGLLGSYSTVGGYIINIESQLVDLTATNQHNEWMLAKKKAGIIPTPEEAVQNYSECRIEAIDKKTMVLKSVKKGATVSKKTLDQMWDAIEKNEPKDP